MDKQPFYINEHVKKLRELIRLHMHPYNLGDMGETETAIEKLIAYKTGEAHEAQCPGDAVATMCKQCQGDGFIEVDTRQPDGTYQIDCGFCNHTGKLFNPAGAAPATSSRFQENAPSAPQMQDKNFTVRLKANIERLLKESAVIDFGISEYSSPQLQKFMKSLESLKLTDINKPSKVVPQPAGPVWVKVEDGLPPEGTVCAIKYLHGRIRIVDAEYKGLMNNKPYWMENNHSRPQTYTAIEWLDESGPQVFTREQVIEIAKFSMVGVKAGDLKNFSDLMEYMSTNYPTK